MQKIEFMKGKWEESPLTYEWNKLMAVEFPVTESEKHTFGVEILEDVLKIDCEGRKMMLRIDNLPKLMHVGINACEGINRFYSLSIDGSKDAAR